MTLTPSPTNACQSQVSGVNDATSYPHCDLGALERWINSDPRVSGFRIPANTAGCGEHPWPRACRGKTRESRGLDMGVFPVGIGQLPGLTPSVRCLGERQSLSGIGQLCLHSWGRGGPKTGARPPSAAPCASVDVIFLTVSESTCRSAHGALRAV